MTENEVLIKTPEEAIETIKSNMPTSGYQMLRESLDMAIIALKEIQQYREIGTVEECREMASIISKVERNELAKIIDEWLLYKKIGTVEECREAVEKQKVKYIKIEAYCPAYCPTCRFELSESLGDGYYKYFENLSRCPKCGQKICWDENLEEREDE